MVECKICGKKYEVCAESREKNSWKVLCDTSEHYQIFLLLTDYKAGNISKEYARERLAELGIKKGYKDNFKKNIKEIIDEILKVKKEVVKEPVEEQENVNEEVASFLKRRKK
jgi:hypothetical protein